MVWSLRQRCVPDFVYSGDQFFNSHLLNIIFLLFANNGTSQSDDGKQVEIVSPPADAPIGERVFIDGLSGEPASSAQVKKRKIWDSVAKGLKTGENGVATWDGKEIKTSVGVCSASSLVGAPIS